MLIKAGKFKYGGGEETYKILNNMLGSELFFNLVQKVQESGQFSKILEKQQSRYQLQAFKLYGIDCKAIKRIYETLQVKHFQTHQLSGGPNSWNQNQRKVFIWYIIFYTYFLAENNEELSHEHWPTLSTIFFNKRKEFLQFQYLSMIKPTKITWTLEEDQLLVESVRQEGAGRWNEVAKSFFFKSNFLIFKSAKHCRQRWLNHLDDKKKRRDWTLDEDLIILNFVAENGKRWCKLVNILNQTRTEHMIKNRYNSLINRQRGTKREKEETTVSKLRRQLRKQVENHQRKTKEGEEVIKLSESSRLQKIDEQKGIEEQQENKQGQKPLIKIQPVINAFLEEKVEQSQKTSQRENVKQQAMKEQNEVGYIMHEVKRQKEQTNDSQNNLKIKVEQKQLTKMVEKSVMGQPFDYNSYPFINPYTGLGCIPNYSYYWY